jgi:hypothetical protein
MNRSVVRYIANGYEIINYPGPATPGMPQVHYGATIPEAIYWVSLFHDPPPQGTPPVLTGVTPRDQRDAEADPLLNQEAHIGDVDEGGFFVREMPKSSVPGRPQIDQFCPNMDAVHAVLDVIFAPPVP